MLKKLTETAANLGNTILDISDQLQGARLQVPKRREESGGKGSAGKEEDC